jgi:hypothetical protein
MTTKPVKDACITVALTSSLAISVSIPRTDSEMKVQVKELRQQNCH